MSSPNPPLFIIVGRIAAFVLFPLMCLFWCAKCLRAGKWDSIWFLVLAALGVAEVWVYLTFPGKTLLWVSCSTWAIAAYFVTMLAAIVLRALVRDEFQKASV